MGRRLTPRYNPWPRVLNSAIITHRKMTRQPFNPDLIRTPAQEPFPRLPTGPMTVSQVTTLVKRAIETNLPATLYVVGEMSNFKRHAGGHLYFTLKDSFSEISCVMWRSAAEKLKFAPADGMEVIATGGVEVFERAGRYQLYVRKLEPRGIGALELAFRQLCEKLAKEGLFDEVRKRPIPRFPRRIALVTSPTGAAIADMLRTIERRYPCVEVLLFPVRVQGEGAAREIAAAVRTLNASAASLGGIDLMIVGRGGGSLEDLWAFNEEVVARAIYASRIPIISAVGHEIDVTIADLVADVRAATPTAAAELAVPVLEEVVLHLDAHELGLRRCLRSRLDLLGARLDGVRHRSAIAEPLVWIRRREQLLDGLQGEIHRGATGRISFQRRRLDRFEPLLQRIAPHRLLRRRAIALRDREHRLRWSVAARLGSLERGLDQNERSLGASSPAYQLPRHGERVTRLAETLAAALRHRFALGQEQCRRQDDLLQAMSYKSVLGRGYSITRVKKARRVVRSVNEVTDDERLVTEVTDGQFESQVVNRRQMELFE